MASAAERVLYLDASALVKLVVEEPGSGALEQGVRGAVLFSSELAVTELGRAAHTIASTRGVEVASLLRGAEAVLARVALLKIERSILVAAGSIADPLLRTLDAIHVATALSVARLLEAFVTYDARQRAAAAGAGLRVLAPA